MLRHYCAFAGIVCGQRARDFFKDLSDWRLATAYACAHGGARILYLHHRGLYQAIGERDSRLRRPTPIARAVERLMVLDAVLASADVTWLATERDKLAHFTLLLKSRLDREELPHLRFAAGTSTTIRYPDRLPIGVHAVGWTHVFTYLVNRDVSVDFRPFLPPTCVAAPGPVPVARETPCPQAPCRCCRSYEAAWREELSSPLRLSTADELRWYFEQRRRLAETGSNGHDET
jgi:hypothetical protein